MSAAAEQPESADAQGGAETEEQRRAAAVRQFCDVTGAGEEVAVERLAKCNYQVEMAVQDYLNVQEGQPSVLPASPPAASNSGGHGADASDDDDGGGGREAELRRRRAVQAYEPAPQASTVHVHTVARMRAGRRMGWLEWGCGWLRLPFQFAYYSAMVVVRFVWGFVYGVAHEFLGHRRVMVAGDPDADVRRFKERFTETFGAGGAPQFAAGSYSELLERAKADLRFALVYLHSWPHPDCEVFARDTLCYPDAVKFVDENLLLWACDVQSAEGQRVAYAIRATSYPCLGLLCFRDGRMALVARILGAQSPQELIASLAAAIVDNQPHLEAVRQQRRQAELDKTLRREQERDYERALQEDRERKARQQQEREASLQKARAEEAAAEKRRREADELERKRAALLAGMADEPTERPYVKLQLRFPDGSRHARAFRPDAPLSQLFAYAFTRPHCPAVFSVLTSYPKRRVDFDFAAFLAGDKADFAGAGASFASAGVSMDCVLVVQDETEEEEE